MEKKKNAAIGDVLWAGRMSTRPDADSFDFQASIKIDQKMIEDDIQGSIAHVEMLGKQKIIPSEAAAQISEELKNIAADIAGGKLKIDETAEDIHSFVENVLTQRLGAVGKMVHAGRSRNDQVALDIRLYLRRKIPIIITEITNTINVLLDIAGLNTQTIMPGYTHLQRAQVLSLAHHLTAWSCALLRDGGRFSDSLKRIDQSPLGSGALAGTTLPLDRRQVSDSLLFAAPTLNSMDSVADRDFAVEFASCCAVTQVHLSRFCEDIVLWSSEEFKYISLSDSFSTGSSIMPQKKNPDFAELIRGKSGRTIGNLVTLLTVLKGTPYAYNKDLQEDKEALFDSLETTERSLRVFRGMMAAAVFNKERMEENCNGAFLEATDAAEYLVKKGLPFRRAHEAAAGCVRMCIAQNKKTLRELSLEDFQKTSTLFCDDIYNALDIHTMLEARTIPGGPAPNEVSRQITRLKLALKKLETANRKP